MSRAVSPLRNHATIRTLTTVVAENHPHATRRTESILELRHIPGAQTPNPIPQTPQTLNARATLSTQLKVVRLPGMEPPTPSYEPDQAWVRDDMDDDLGFMVVVPVLTIQR